MNKIIEIGKFYFIHDSSKTGHPGLIIWKDDDKNLYLAVKFGTSPNKNNFLFKHPVGENIINSYVYKRPFLGKRKDFDKRSLKDMMLNDKEIKILYKEFDYSNPVYSKNINRKDKRYYRWWTKRQK